MLMNNETKTNAKNNNAMQDSDIFYGVSKNSSLRAWTFSYVNEGLFLSPCFSVYVSICFLMLILPNECTTRSGGKG